MTDSGCKYCRQDAEYAVQWGPQAGQKEYACDDHIRELLASIKAPEMWVIKVKVV